MDDMRKVSVVEPLVTLEQRKEFTSSHASAVAKAARGIGATVGWAWHAVIVRYRAGRKTPPG